ncbi:bifunctional cobalt-precorrin-7 (C(5))-methyltransferase/cobalt-precorrin-6B (C(15))-methyltransferase [Cognatishimia activa]|uniref:Precorrin-6Y C(5,15)-methyltransferase [decarboxylating] n=1 Tax=Cognatishimia activa TaxID=1715691 RepID=A0A0P1J628_9RHOB|nr:bifunctional cobalt-precorrin-7 (C(5))-methyltransferase/cobalt-precorrin-6B (C(15))-methyltransferase [Cognatishimia activa]CUI89424.1 Precorrin-6Y C(5,15)-methyltransferase [decarboxylating] [Cognatishimia activa]CUK25669.1 Precorrin-6Y C(5,15)-methyltransferase [decarboxylating] [Cognatishimia activa]
MADPVSHPWLTIVGLGEDGADGLPPASLKALENAKIIMGAKRHLGLLPDVDAELVEWPVPFADGISVLQGFKGQETVVLASGDPFWHGAGGALLDIFDQKEVKVLPGVSSLSLAAARLGWPLEKTPCLGLHAAPFERLRPLLAEGRRVFCTVRDGDAVKALGAWLDEAGFGSSLVHILEALGGPRERVRVVRTSHIPDDIQHPVLVGLDVRGDGQTLPFASGRPDAFFGNDGQITKSPIRAMTLSALAPTFGEHLWDIGGGSGSIGIEWCLADASLSATIFEIDRERSKRIETNAHSLGVSVNVVTGPAPETLRDQRAPDVVFIGGGISAQMLDWIWTNVSEGKRLVANGVTLEAEALLAAWHREKGGKLLRIDLSEAAPLGSKRGWKANYPIVQWSVTL